jgi:autotransporter translocation and assembly factor TamB
MIRTVRRALQIVALIGTLLVGIVALSLIVSQTPWFRDWLRRYIVRESRQYLNGELSIGGLTGNLFFGVGLSDVAVDVSGQRVVAVKALQVDYSVFQILSTGIIIDNLKLIAPAIHVERDGNGWNLGRLVRKQAEEADRKGPRRPIALPSIELTDGTVVVGDKVGSTSYKIPSRIDGLHLKGSFHYEPVHYSVTLEDLGFHGTSPNFTLQQLTGGFSVRDDNLYLERVRMRTGESNITIGGAIEAYLRTPVFKFSTTGTAALAEIGRVVPPLSGYPLTPAFDVKGDGPADRMVLDVDVKSETGNFRGKLTSDLKTPDLSFTGEADIERLNAAPILKAPAQRTDLTGHTKFDLTLASTPSGARALDRLRGTFAFTGPHAAAVGYQASNVRVSGSIAGPRITFEGQAAAYGGSATTTGFVVIPATGKQVAFDLRGRAASIDLTRLPAITGAPKLSTNLNTSEYQVRGAAGRVEGSSTLEASEVEGAAISPGTVARFETSKGALSYWSKGEMSYVDLQRVGRVFHVEALDKPEFGTRLNSTFEVEGSGTTLDKMKLDATGTLTDSDAWGAKFPQLEYETHLNGRSLDARARGRFEHLDPARVIGNDKLKGLLTGTADVHTSFADLKAPMTLDAVSADGTVNLEGSSFGDLEIESALVTGKYAAKVGDISQLTLSGPDLKLQASGRVALDDTSASNLNYHVEATDLSRLGRLAGQDSVEGSGVLDGTLTGNASSLQTTGKMNGSGLGWNGNTALDANAQYTITVPDLDVAKVQVKSTANATFVKVGALELNEVTATTTYQNSQLDFDGKVKQEAREADARGDVIFHPDHQEIHLPSLAVRTQGIEWRTAPGSAAALRYGNERIELQDVKLVSGDQAIDASGAVSLKGSQPGTALTVNARNVDISQIERLALQNRGFSGRIDAAAKIEGSLDQPLVNGSVTVTNGGFRNYKYDSLTAKVDYNSTRVGLDATLRQSPTAAIAAQGTIPMTLFQRSEAGHVAARTGDDIDLHITSTPLELGLIQGFTTAVTDVTGVLRLDLRLTGAGEDPHAEGIIDIRGGAFAVPATGVSYSGLDTSISVSPDGLTIPNLQIVDEKGERMTITGTLGLHAREVGAVDVTVTSRNFELLDNELGDVGVETNLKVTGELRRPKIEGDVKLQAARVEVDKILALFYDPYSVNAIPDVVSAEQTVEGGRSAEDATNRALSNSKSIAPAGTQQTGEASTAPAPTSGFAPVQLQLHVRIPENLVLRGQSLRPGGPTRTAIGDINITVGGDLDVTKEPDGPVILLGSVDTVRGTYQFQGRRFDLVRGGTVQFTGEPDINPLLDVTATREIPNSGVEARVHIKGSVRSPELELTSDPPLDESDILSLIVFNRPVNELGTGERTSLAATAGGIATGFLAAPLGQSIGRALDLDLFEITPSTDTGDLGAGVTVGQQIGDRAFLRLRQQFGERTTSEFMVEYRLTDFLRMQGNAAPETSGSANRIGQRRIERAGIDVIFFFSY